MFFFFVSAPSDERMVKKRRDDELLRGGRSDITHVFIFPFLPLSLSFALNTKLLVFLTGEERVVVVCLETEREGIRESEREYISFPYVTVFPL